MSDPTQPIPAEVLAGIVGQRSWLVERGHGSFLTMEFGEPRIEVREAVPHATSAALRRPGAWPRGDWHLWIYCCQWRIEEGGVPLAHSESTDAAIDKAARAINGQILTDVSIDAPRGMSRFIFELGTVLETSRLDADDISESWLLYTPIGRVLTYRDDGLYSWSEGSTEPDDEVWLPVPPSANAAGRPAQTGGGGGRRGLRRRR